eukprot:1191464-Prorocentrum_minimum.AAC.4
MFVIIDGSHDRRRAGARLDYTEAHVGWEAVGFQREVRDQAVDPHALCQRHAALDVQVAVSEVGGALPHLLEHARQRQDAQHLARLMHEKPQAPEAIRTRIQAERIRRLSNIRTRTPRPTRTHMDPPIPIIWTRPDPPRPTWTHPDPPRPN